MVKKVRKQYVEYKKRWWGENKDRINRKRREKRMVDDSYRLHDLKKNKIWAINNREKSNAIKRRWVKNNSEKVAVANKKWQESNPEKRDRINARHRKTDLCRATKRRNQMKRKGCEASKDTLTQVLNENFLQFGLTCCENCHTSIWDRYEFDHIIPIALGGDGNYDNLQILCKSCNIEKMTNAIDFRRFIR